MKGKGGGKEKHQYWPEHRRRTPGKSSSSRRLPSINHNPCVLHVGGGGEEKVGKEKKKSPSDPKRKVGEEPKHPSAKARRPSLHLLKQHIINYSKYIFIFNVSRALAEGCLGCIKNGKRGGEKPISSWGKRGEKFAVAVKCFSYPYTFLCWSRGEWRRGRKGKKKS